MLFSSRQRSRTHTGRLTSILVTLFLVAPFACGQERSTSTEELAPPGLPPSVNVPAVADEAQQRIQAVVSDDPRKIIRTANLELVVADTEQAAQDATELTQSLDGFVGSLNARRQDDLLYYDMTIRVPTERFEQAMDALRDLALRVDREIQQVEDVTEQHVDLAAQLTTLRSTEEELRALLSESRQRGREVEDIMAVYRELTTIRSQIERLQGQMNVLERRIAFSVISVELVPDAASRPIVSDEWRPNETVRTAVRLLVGALKSLVDFAIYVVILLAPIAIVVGLPFFLLNRWLKRRRD